jgi:hypothetical protein
MPKKTLNVAELVHFFVPFPAGRVVKPTTVISPNGDKHIYPPITINVESWVSLKNAKSCIEGLSTHWLTNIDTNPTESV